MWILTSQAEDFVGPQVIEQELLLVAGGPPWACLIVQKKPLRQPAHNFLNHCFHLQGHNFTVNDSWRRLRCFESRLRVLI